MAGQCTHLDQIKFTHTDKHVCEDCVRTGDTWVHLRMCLGCGHMGCFDSSKNKHATKHFQETKHPLMRSAEPHEDWIWCYVDEVSPGALRANGFVPIQE
ncbi:MAG TPA: UBP-type zinc finger domain-containing protein [Terriglobales bacterium]|nr:UBP-type zinc finger domain-containing protein [Terriglobales bacterium]